MYNIFCCWLNEWPENDFSNFYKNLFPSTYDNTKRYNNNKKGKEWEGKEWKWFLENNKKKTWNGQSLRKWSICYSNRFLFYVVDSLVNCFNTTFSSLSKLSRKVTRGQTLWLEGRIWFKTQALWLIIHICP